MFGPALLAQTQANTGFASLAAKADEARVSNRLDEAVTLYSNAVAMRPDWAEGWWSLGTLYYDKDDYARAAEALQKVVNLSPRAGAALAMLGLCEAKLGRNEAALRHIEAGGALGGAEDPQLRRVMLFTKGTLLLAAGQFGKAQDVLGALARDGSDRDELILALGRSVLGIMPSDASAPLDLLRRAGRAEYYAARREIQNASREYGSLATDFPRMHNVQFAYGRFLLANHEDDKAIPAFEREIENTPNHLLARLGIAGIKLVRDPASGLPYAEKAVELAPELPEAHYLLGALLLETGNSRRAIYELETARAGAPKEAKIHFALGRAYASVNRKGDAARARAIFKQLNEQSEGEAYGKHPAP